MTKKTNGSQKRTAKLPVGVKPAQRPISPQKLKMLMEDRGIASGGRNIVHRQKTTGAAR